MKKLFIVFAIVLLSASSAIAQVRAPQTSQMQAQGAGGVPSTDQASQEAAAKAQEAIATSTKDQVKVVKHKAFLKEGRFEFAPVVGMSVNDPLKRRLPVGAHAIYHFGEGFALGLTGLYNVNMESSDVVIIRKSGAPPEVTDLKYNASLDFYFSPIYGKFSLFSNLIVNFDMFLVGGIGMMAADMPDETTMSALSTTDLASSNSLKVAGNLGLGTRIFLSKWIALNLEMRDYIYMMRLTNVTDSELSDVQNVIIPFVGVGFYIPPSAKYSD